jgi:hypothetical protein
MSDRARRLGRFAPAAVVLALAVAWLVPEPDWIRLATPDTEAAQRMDDAIAGLPDEPDVLVGFDPDLGTYAEVRPTARAVIDDLLARDAVLSVVSLTPEGRALALAEIARLRRGGVPPERIVDLGFLAGAEAGLVDVADELAATRQAAVVVVGGNDIGPRSWIEQVLPRIDEVPLLAVTPTVLLPEVRPFVASGQIDSALVTPREGAAYREGPSAATADELGEIRDPAGLALLVGMLVALAALGQALGARLVGAVRSAPSRETG